VSDWRSVPVSRIGGAEVLDEDGRVLASRPSLGWADLRAVFRLRRSPTEVVGPHGIVVFAYETKIGPLTNWLKVRDPNGALIARIDQIGNLFTAFRRRYTIRDASGAEIGRIDSPRIKVEYVVLDGDGQCVARGVRRGESGWQVEREVVKDSPWPEIVTAFFLSGIGTARQGSSV
jgi:hypothetical protein